MKEKQNNKRKETRDKSLLVMVIVLIVIVIVSGATLAYYSWNSTSGDKDINIGVTTIGLTEDDITFTYSVNDVDLIPVSLKSSGRIATFSVSQNAVEAARGTITLTLTTLSSDLAHPTFKYELVEVNSNGTETTIVRNNFGSKSQGDVITLANNLVLNKDVTYNYKLYIWIDGIDLDYPINPSEMQNKSYDFKLNMEVTDSLE